MTDPKQIARMMTEDPDVPSNTNMPQPNGYRFRVYKFEKNTYDAFANFTSLKEAVEYMRRWNPNQMHNWYIVDEDTGRKFEMDNEERLVMVS